MLSWTIVLLGLTVLAAPSDLSVEITAQRKSHEAQKVGDARPGDTAKGGETCMYDITVANKGLKDTPPLDVKYVVFVQRERLGEKKGLEQIQRVAGAKSIDPIKSNGKIVVTTETIGLNKSRVGGDWIYSDGGKISAKDSAKGIWVKLYQGETMVAEYSLPTTIKEREKWDK